MGERGGALKELISAYKYQSVRAASFELADLLNSVIDGKFILVPLPTIRKHVRERGFDHIALICRKMGLPMTKILRRRKNYVQVGASVEERRIQANGAYEAVGVDADVNYLLVDDVWTTGSSMAAACEAMRAAGATKNLAIAVIARSK